MDLKTVDKLLTTTRTVRKRLDLTRPVEREVLEECLQLAIQAPTGGKSSPMMWRVAPGIASSGVTDVIVGPDPHAATRTTMGMGTHLLRFLRRVCLLSISKVMPAQRHEWPFVRSRRSKARVRDGCVVIDELTRITLLV